MGLECCPQHLPAVSAYLGEYVAEPVTERLRADLDWHALGRALSEGLDATEPGTTFFSLEQRAPIPATARGTRGAAHAAS